MPQPSKEILACFSAAYSEALKRIPYVYGGGHTKFGPTIGVWDSSIVGYDCSGWASYILHKGGILYSEVPLNTHGFENWGLPGRGEFMTLWVRNAREEEHCFLEFTLPGKSL